jgi:hypothetical protein
MPATGAGAASAASTSEATTSDSANGQARKIFEQLDTNHDGVLSFEEFSRATFQQPK